MQFVSREGEIRHKRRGVRKTWKKTERKYQEKERQRGGRGEEEE